MSTDESGTATPSAPEADAAKAAPSVNQTTFDDDSDIEDLEFLIDDIEDQIAPLG
jgi:hypothetical protein